MWIMVIIGTICHLGSGHQLKIVVVVEIVHLLVRAEAELDIHDDSVGSETSERRMEPETAFPIDEVANRIMERLANATYGSVKENEPQIGCSFETFCKQNPIVFYGKSGPMEAENWLMQMEDLHEVLESTDDQKVKYTAF